MLNFLIGYKFSIILAMIIALLSLIPGSSMPETPLFSVTALDKIAHFSLYALLSFVALLESRCQPCCPRYHMVLLLVIFLLSTVIEVLQATVIATRSAEWFDLLANFTGTGTGYVAFRCFKSIRS